jgi:hypothetical protein
VVPNYQPFNWFNLQTEITSSQYPLLSINPNNAKISFGLVLAHIVLPIWVDICILRLSIGAVKDLTATNPMAIKLLF